ncbi:MAG: hypothetical protein ABIF85_00910 [Nanoarchaeota archaeon]|nr:hypothetical protein [archaeon]
MATLQNLEKEIEKLKERNIRVEADKAWETSYSRRMLLMVYTYLAVGFYLSATYLAVGFYLSAIKIASPWMNAIVPTVGLCFQR